MRVRELRLCFFTLNPATGLDKKTGIGWKNIYSLAPWEKTGNLGQDIRYPGEKPPGALLRGSWLRGVSCFPTGKWDYVLY